MNLARPFVSTWTWYRERRWWVKIPLGGLILLLLSAGIYVGVRAAQYSAFEKRAGSFIPSMADILVDAPKLSKSIPTLQKSGAWKAIEKKVLRDPTLKAWMADFGFPTIEDLESKRFEKETGGWVSYDTLYLVAGSDAALAVDLPSENEMNFCAATKLGFREFLAVPFLWMVSGFAGIEQERIGGFDCLKVEQGQTVWVAADGPVMVASSSRDMMEQALKQKRVPATFRGPLKASVALTRSPLIREMVETLATGELAHLMPDLDVRAAETVEIELDVDDREVTLQTQWDGEIFRSEVPFELARLAPEDAAVVLTSSLSTEDVWKWVLERLPGIYEQNGLMDETVREQFQLLRESSFGSQFVPHAKRGSAAVLGKETLKRDGLAYLALAAAIPVDDAPRAFQALERFIDEVSEEGSVWTRTEWRGRPFTSLTARKVPLKELEFVRLSYTWVDKFILIGNNPDFIKRVADVINGQRPSLLEDPEAGTFLQETDRGVLLIDSAETVAMFEAAVPMWAAMQTDTEEMRTQVWSELSRQGVPKSQLNDRGYAEMERRKKEYADGVWRQIRMLSHLRRLGVQAKAHDGGTRVDVVLEFK